MTKPTGSASSEKKSAPTSFFSQVSNVLLGAIGLRSAPSPQHVQETITSGQITHEISQRERVQADQQIASIREMIK